MVTLFLIVRNAVYRETLVAALAAPGRFSVTGMAGRDENPLTVVREVDPDLLLLDLPINQGLPLVRALRHSWPGGRILVLGSPEEETESANWTAEGAIRVMSADASLEDLRDAIDQIAREGRRGRIGELAARSASSILLTSREREIVSLIDEGLSNREIAAGLTIELSTVKNHVHHILEKLHAHRRSQAAAWVAGRRHMTS